MALWGGGGHCATWNGKFQTRLDLDGRRAARHRSGDSCPDLVEPPQRSWGDAATERFVLRHELRQQRLVADSGRPGDPDCVGDAPLLAGGPCRARHSDDCHLLHRHDDNPALPGQRVGRRPGGPQLHRQPHASGALSRCGGDRCLPLATTTSSWAAPSGLIEARLRAWVYVPAARTGGVTRLPVRRPSVLQRAQRRGPRTGNRRGMCLRASCSHACHHHRTR
jgi:hypothetical protein